MNKHFSIKKLFPAALVICTLLFSGTVLAVESDTPPALNLSEEPPSLNIEIPTDNGNEEEIEITDFEADPNTFDPAGAYTLIKYEINKDAIIEMKILKTNNDTVITLVDDIEKDAGEHEVKWYGREDNEENGDKVSAGDYKFKITAKNTDTEEMEDTAEGTIGIVHTAERDEDDDQTDATMTIQNSTTGQTAGTGPGVLIYFLFPLGGYLIARSKK